MACEPEKKPSSSPQWAVFHVNACKTRSYPPDLNQNVLQNRLSRCRLTIFEGHELSGINMTKHPESSGSSLPREDSGLDSQLSSSFGKHGLKPLDAPDPKLRRRSGLVRKEISSSAEEKSQSSKDNSTSLPANQTAPRSKTKPKLTTFAPKSRSGVGDVARSDTLAVEQADRPAFLDPPTIDENLLGDSMQAWNSAEEDYEPETFGRRLVPIPSFLVSVAVHLAVFLALALIAVQVKLPPIPAISIVAEFDSIPTPVKPKVPADSQTVEIVDPLENRSPLEMTSDALSTDNEMEIAAETNVIPSPIANDLEPTPVENSSAITAVAATLPSGGGLEGREEASRARLAASRGGSRASEIAVENGIRWIINHQREDGSWHFKHIDGKCDGSCRNEGKQESTTAATGLALMSMLGAGYTQRTGPYQEEVRKGLAYLVEKMRVSAHGGSLVQGENGMYSHAIATLALSEAYAMTRDTSLVQPIDLARQYIENAQHKKGGWRYVPGTVGDMVVTGWQVMALKSCERAGFPTGEVTWDRAGMFVDSLGTTDGKYGYRSPKSGTPTTTAVGILSQMYLGAALEDEQIELGAQYLVEQKPSKTDMYFNYYTTLVLHHRSDQDWPKWNVELRDYLINTQDNGGTHQAGSWYFADHHGAVGGRLYTTAMAVMTLEVYYRYMPLYSPKAVVGFQ